MQIDQRNHDRIIAAAQSLGPAIEALAMAAREDPAVFCQFVLRDETSGKAIQLAPMHEEWHDVLTEHPRVVLFSATELGKTSQVSVGRVLFEIGRNPNIRILILSSSSSMAKKIVKSIKGYIENSPEYHLVFPEVAPDKSDTSGQWRDDAFIVRRKAMPKDPTVQASGYGGNVLGSRYDLIIIDDYLTAENTYSDHLRQKFYGWLKSTIESRRTADARLWFIGNAWHLDDAMHKYAAERGTYSKKYPVMVDGESAWPEVWPLSRIQAEIAIRGPIESRRSMFCDPVSDEDRRFKWKYIEIALELGNGFQCLHALNMVPPGYRTVTGVDLAVTKKETGDETSLVTVGVNERDHVRQIIDIQCGRWGGPEIVNRIMDTHSRYHSVVWVESNAQQMFIKQFVNDVSAVPVKAHFTGKNKHDPAFGIESLAIEMSAGKWRMPNMGGATAGMQAKMHPNVKKLITQMLAYDPSSHTGDVLMACLPPGQLITTKRGLVAIESIQTGDQVLTHRSRWRPVTGTTTREYVGDVIDIRPRGMNTLTVTDEHPVYRATPMTRTWDRTNHLIPDEASWEFVAAADLRAGRKMDGDYIFAPAAPWPCAAPPADRDLAFLIGLYMAEGSTSDHQVYFYLHQNETYLVDFVRMMARRRWDASVSTFPRPGSKGVSVVVNSKAAQRFFKPFGCRDRKALPWTWMAIEPGLGTEIVRGWMMGDGSMSRSRDGSPHLRAVSVSRSLVYQMQQFLWRAGIGTSVCAFKQSGFFQGKPCSNLPAQQLSLSASDSSRLMANPRVEEILRWGGGWAETRTRSNSSSIERDGGMAVRIGAVGTRRYEGPVFNMHVADDESYVAEGIAVHNCWIAREGARKAMSPAGVTKRGRRT